MITLTERQYARALRTARDIETGAAPPPEPEPSDDISLSPQTGRLYDLMSPDREYTIGDLCTIGGVTPQAAYDAMYRLKKARLVTSEAIPKANMRGYRRRLEAEMEEGG